MVDVSALILHVVKTADDNPTMIKRTKEFRMVPKDNENMLMMKEQIAKKLSGERDKGKWTYWYVVVEIDQAGGGKLYRTIIKKTFF